MPRLVRLETTIFCIPTDRGLNCSARWPPPRMMQAGIGRARAVIESAGGDGSPLLTQGSAKPAVTISALAARTPDGLRKGVPDGDVRSCRRSPAEVYAA
jgi:hypothetical protein